MNTSPFILTLEMVLTSSGKYPSRPKLFPPDELCLHNAGVLIQRVTKLWTSYDSPPRPPGKPEEYHPKDLFVNSGYRPPSVNAKTKGAAAKSWHQYCAALDIQDPVAPIAGRLEFGRLGRWVVDNIDTVNHFGLWVEAPDQTPGWLHVQIYPPPSGKKIFRVR